MTTPRIAAKFAVPIAVAMMVLTGCQGAYVAGDAGPHSTRATTQFQAAPTRR